MTRGKGLPESAYNWTSIAGAVLALGTFSIIVLLLLIDAYVEATTAYLGLLTFVVLPVFVVLGLLLIAVGMVVERRRLQRGEHGHFQPDIHVDLRKPAHRNALLIFTVGTTVFLVSSAVGAYHAYQETESVEFCGTLCHAVMHPEYTAYQQSPHARVACAECHIGAGADWFVKSKLSGAYQVYAALAENYPRPIPTPIQNLRPARETCEHCHWPKQFFGARKDVNPHFLGDEENTPYPVTLLLNVGGGGGEHGEGDGEGIHWHVAQANRVEYAAPDDDRMEISWVRLTDGAGQVKEWTLGGEAVDAASLAETGSRTMDCIDCHNRPSHIYRSPMRAVNQALARGAIDRRLPYIKREAVLALDQVYDDTPAALAAIETHVRGFYEEEFPEVVESQAVLLDSAIAGIRRVYTNNIFPEMKVTWRAYPDHIGHSEFLGCFRCHGSDLQTEAGETISKDCSLCHVILSQGSGPMADSISPAGLPFVHPVDIDGDEFYINCTDCHEGGAEFY